MTKNSSQRPAKPIYLRTWFIVVTAVAAFAIIGALNPSKSQPNAAPTPTPTEVESEVTFENKGCLSVSPTLLNGIGQGFGGSELSGKAAGFIASDFADVKFIALEFTPTGETTSQIAIFGTNDDDLSDDIINGLVIPVDGFAKEFSDWGQSAQVDLSVSDQGVAESKECLALIK